MLTPPKNFAILTPSRSFLDLPLTGGFMQYRNTTIYEKSSLIRQGVIPASDRAFCIGQSETIVNAMGRADN
jgi:hypothetical protein